MAVTDAERLDFGGSEGSIMGAVAGKIAFYGRLPVVQRPFSSAVHATAGIASSSDFGATQLAAVREIQNTLIGLGIWATA